MVCTLVPVRDPSVPIVNMGAFLYSRYRYLGGARPLRNGRFAMDFRRSRKTAATNTCFSISGGQACIRSQNATAPDRDGDPPITRPGTNLRLTLIM